MNAYIYQAALWCGDCIGDIKLAHAIAGTAPADPNDENSYDSDDYPKGPFSDGGGEADCPQHCDGCQVFLENPLTPDGAGYITAAVNDDIQAGRLDSIACTIWAPFYEVQS